jgi:hypothetical protein
MKNYRRHDGKCSAAAFAVALALVVTLAVPGVAGYGGDNAGFIARGDVARADAAPVPVAQTELSGEDVYTEQLPGGVPAGGGDTALDAEPGDGNPVRDVERAGKNRIADKRDDRASLEREIDSKTINPEPGQEHDGYIVVMSDDFVNDGDESVVDEAVAAGYSAAPAGDYIRVDEPSDVLDFADPRVVEKVIPNYAIYPAADFPSYPYGTNDEHWKDQKNLWPFETDVPDVPTSYGIGAYGIYSRGLSGSGIDVGIFDTGLTYNPDLREDFTAKNGINFATMAGDGVSTDSALDYHGHGTKVTGLIAATVNNGEGVAGLTDQIEVYPYRVFNPDSGSLYTILYGLEYLIERDQLPDVINMSLGTDTADEYVGESVREVFDLVASEGSIVIAAAGNNLKDKGIHKEDFLSYPASFDSVISVANSYYTNGGLNDTSHENNKVDVTAPGTDVYSLNNWGSAGNAGYGTSFSSPQVAGVAVAVKQIDPSADVYAFRYLIAQTSNKIGAGTGAFEYDANGYSKSYGYGLIDAEAMLSYLGQPGLYRVKYDLGGGNIDKSCVPVSYVTEGELSQGVALPGESVMKRNEYIFDGWRLNDGGSELTSLDSSVLPECEGNVIELKARWLPDSTLLLKASDFSVTYAEARWMEEVYYGEIKGPGLNYRTAITSYAAFAKLEIGSGDRITSVDVISASDYFTDVTADEAEGTYIIEFTSLNGATTNVAMTVYNPEGNREAAVDSTRYDSTQVDGGNKNGAVVIASTADIGISLSAISDADIAGMTGAKASKWDRSGRAIRNIGATAVTSGGLESVVQAGEYTVWVAPEGHEDERLTLSAIVTGTGDEDENGDDDEDEGNGNDDEDGDEGNGNGGDDEDGDEGNGNDGDDEDGDEGNGNGGDDEDGDEGNGNGGNEDGNNGGSNSDSNNNDSGNGNNVVNNGNSGNNAGNVTYYKVTFSAPDSVGGDPGPLDLGYGMTIPELPVPVRPGYEFLGWRISGSETRFNSGAPFNYGANIVVVAKWLPKRMTIKAGSYAPYAVTGKSIPLSAEISGESVTADDTALKWEIVSLGGTAAKVGSDSGVFTAGNKEGTVTVRASSAYLPSVYTDLTVTVAKPVTKIVIPVKHLYMEKGSSFVVPVSENSAGGDSAKLTWESSNWNVVSVDSSGKIRAFKNGAATVTAKSLNGVSAKFKVNVVSKAKSVAKLKVRGYDKSMKKGKTSQLKISYSPASATVTKISFSSSRSSVLHVDGVGKLTAKKKGTAYITVKVGNKSQKIKIQVK